MNKIQRTLRIFLFVAASMLVVNDCVRLVVSFHSDYFIAQYSPQNQEEENNPINPFSIFEEEVKHKDCMPAFSFKTLDPGKLEDSVAPLIKDDEVRHLAYLAIFTPPPNMA